MSGIDVRPQVDLSLARTFALCLKGIRHRLFRSVLTTLVIVLAVAFFMVLLGDSIIARSVGRGVQTEIRSARAATIAVELWTGHPAPAVVAARLTAPDAPLTAYAGLCHWDQSRLDRLAQAVRREHQITTWFDAMDAGTRTQLVEAERADEALARLATADGWQLFMAELPKQRALRTPIPVAELQAAAQNTAATATELTALTSAWSSAVAALDADLQRESATSSTEAALTWIATATPMQLSGIAGVLARHGLMELFPVPVLTSLQADIRRDRQREEIVRDLRSDEVRSRWFKAFRVQPSLEDKLLALADPRAVEVLGGRYTAPELGAVARMVADERNLARKEQALAGKISEDGGLVSVRQGFLILISLMVCMVGIANAMLMAITERFREIATMKCLGATDSYILNQFLLEAGVQGVCGGAIGTVIGLLFALVKGSWSFGGHLFWYFPGLEVAGACLACIVIGLVLATIASIYPSWMASRMAPMEAMRIE